MRRSDPVADMPPARRVHETKKEGALKDSKLSYASPSLARRWMTREGTWAGEVASNARLTHILSALGDVLID